MKSTPGQAPASIELLCFSIGEVKIGADTSQITEISGAEEYSNDFPTLLNVELLPESRRSEYVTPTVLIVSDLDRTYRLAIEQPEDMVTVPLREIRPLPPLIERYVLQRGFWGVFPFRGNNYLLLDLVRLSRSFNRQK